MAIDAKFADVTPVIAAVLRERPMPDNIKGNLNLELSRCRLLAITANPLPARPEKSEELVDRISKKLGANGWQTVGGTFEGDPLRWVSVQGSSNLALRSALCLMDYDRHLYAYLLVDTDCEAAVIDKWAAAIETGLPELIQPRDEFSWWAVLGPDPPKCKECRQKLFNPRRKLFEEALNLVVPPERARWLAKIYGRRSGTAHRGRLFGREYSLGDYLGDYSFLGSEPQRFENSVYSLKRAAKTLLRRVLGNEVAKQV